MKKYICAVLALALCVPLLGCDPTTTGPTDTGTETTISTSSESTSGTETVVSKMGDFTLEFGDPVVVAQGEVGDNAWGHFQFPRLMYTQDGYIRASWAYGTDTIEYKGSSGRMISTDGGQSWVSSAGYSIVSSENLMPNGKYFAGFVGKGAHKVDYLDNYTPAFTWDDYKLFFAEDLPENEDTLVYATEYDPETGETSRFLVTVNWPYAPIVQYPGKMVYPMTQTFSLSGRSVITIDNVLYYCLYTSGFDSTAASREEAVSPYCEFSSVYLFKSTDCGRTWDFLSQLSTDGLLGNFTEGLNEPEMTVMPDGSIIMLMRSGSRSPCYITRSTDLCQTWSDPVEFDTIGVFPQLLTLDCGVTLATYGRPNMKLRATSDPTGLTWKPPMNLDSLLAGGMEDTSCYYTDLLALDEYTALWIYSDFMYPNENGTPVKSIITRTITVIPE